MFPDRSHDEFRPPCPPSTTAASQRTSGSEPRYSQPSEPSAVRRSLEFACPARRDKPSAQAGHYKNQYRYKDSSRKEEFAARAIAGARNFPPRSKHPLRSSAPRDANKIVPKKIDSPRPQECPTQQMKHSADCPGCSSTLKAEQA